MSIITDNDLRRLRRSRGIVPDAADDVVEVWRSGVQQKVGSGQVSANGIPIKSKAPGTAVGPLEFVGAYFCRVGGKGKGKEQEFSEQNTAVTEWKFTFPALLPDTVTDELTKVIKSDELRIQRALWSGTKEYPATTELQPSSGDPDGLYYRCVQAGTSGATPPNWPAPSAGFAAGVWRPAAQFSVADTIRVRGVRYRATASGTTAVTEPDWPTGPATLVVDGGVTWQLCEAVVDGTAVWQVAGLLRRFNVTTSDYGKTYGVLMKAFAQEIL